MTAMTEPPYAAGTRDTRTPLLVGRTREQALLRERLTAALRGRGSLVLIGGEAGIGKTALAEALGSETKARDTLALVGRCYDLSETPPYGPWIEIFERLPATTNSPPFPAPIVQRDAAAIAVSQAALFAQVRDLLVALVRRQPLVVILDDLHWADLASLELLRFLARQLAGLPLLLVATYRSDELGRRHPLYLLLPALVREAEATRLDLRRLEEGGTRMLVRGRYRLSPADEARLVAHLQERAEGNPFFLGELLRALEEEGVLRPLDEGWTVGELSQVRLPTLLRQVIDGRLARLGEGAQRLLAIAAVIGQEVPLPLWATVAAVDEETLLEVVQRAVEAHLLEEAPDGARVWFVHALIRQALYEGLLPELLPSRRRVWHRRVGEALAATPARDREGEHPGPVPDPDAVAYHFRQAGDARRGVADSGRGAGTAGLRLDDGGRTLRGGAGDLGRVWKSAGPVLTGAPGSSTASRGCAATPTHGGGSPA